MTERSVFISYSSHDTDRANRILSFLEASGVCCWIAQRDERVGFSYHLPIMSALQSAKIVLLILSQASNNSPEVQNEIVQATRLRRAIITIVVEPVTPNQVLELSIRRFHMLDAQAGLTEWTLQSLLEAVRVHLSEHAKAKTPSAVERLINLANQGDKNAQFELAVHYSTSQQATKAVEWFRQAAALDHPEAAFQLAVLLRDGSGVLRNEDAALRWFQKAAELGHSDGQVIFANELLLGRRISRDLPAALEWFEKAAALGSVDAQLQAAVLLENGRAGVRDYARAIHWLEPAAAAGHPGAQYLLATLLMEGKGHSQDLERASQLAQMASDGGNLAARKLLSQLAVLRPRDS